MTIHCNTVQQYFTISVSAKAQDFYSVIFDDIESTICPQLIIVLTLSLQLAVPSPKWINFPNLQTE